MKVGFRRVGDRGRRASFVSDLMPAFGKVVQERGGPLWVESVNSPFRAADFQLRASDAVGFVVLELELQLVGRLERGLPTLYLERL